MDHLETQLAQLENAQLIRRLAEEELAYLFKHALTQESAYESLLFSKRRQIHRRVAQAYERLYPDRLDDYAALLAQHYSQAGDEAKTLEHATRAGDVALKVYANAEAIAQYTRALQAAEKCAATGEQLSHLFTKRGRAFELTTHFERALDNYVEMQTVALARGDRSLELTSLSLRTNLHATATPVFDPVQAQQLADRALAVARELGDRKAECQVLWNLLTLNRYADRGVAAIEFGERALTLARELDLPERAAFISTDLGGAYMQVGQINRAQVLLDQARTLWRELDNLPMLSDNLMLSGALALVRGDFDQTVRLTDEGIVLGQKTGNIMSQESNRGTQIQVWFDRGDFAQALRLAEENLRQAETIDVHFMDALAYSNLALICGTLGAYERALEMARRAREKLDQPAPPFFRSWVLAYLAHVYCLSGDLTAAAEMLEQGQAASAEKITPSPL